MHDVRQYVAGKAPTWPRRGADLGIKRVDAYGQLTRPRLNLSAWRDRLRSCIAQAAPIGFRGPGGRLPKRRRCAPATAKRSIPIGLSWVTSKITSARSETYRGSIVNRLPRHGRRGRAGRLRWLAGHGFGSLTRPDNIATESRARPSAPRRHSAHAFGRRSDDNNALICTHTPGMIGPRCVPLSGTAPMWDQWRYLPTVSDQPVCTEAACILKEINQTLADFSADQRGVGHVIISFGGTYTGRADEPQSCCDRGVMLGFGTGPWAADAFVFIACGG